MDLAQIRADREAIEVMRERWFLEWEIVHQSDRPFVEDVVKALYTLHFAVRCWESLNEPHP